MKRRLVEKARQLAEELERIRKMLNAGLLPKVLIITHKHGDTDALASACAIHAFFQEDCCRGNRLSHDTGMLSYASGSGKPSKNGVVEVIVPESISQNAKRVVDKTCKEISIIVAKEPPGDDLLKDAYKIVVDSASLHHLGPLSGPAAKNGIDLLLDHHSRNTLTEMAVKSIVDPDFSSTSELVALALKQLEFYNLGERACLLQAGILADTSRFSRAGVLTFLAMDFLISQCKYETALTLTQPSRRSRSETLAILKAMQRMQIHVGSHIVGITFVGSSEGLVLNQILAAGADGAVVLSRREREVRITYRVRDAAPPSLVKALHGAIKNAFPEAIGPMGHERAGLYVWPQTVSKWDMPRMVKKIVDHLDFLQGS